ncbi:MAG TPA: hypothetical protein VN300_13560 [Desulfobacterales bacterium]|nr:hypothetical protein [Desulfobacterales bacterium]
MHLNRLLWILWLPAMLAAALPALGLDAKSLARLNQAGVSNATLELIVKERTIETAAFTLEELLALKAAGIGEDALQALIREGSFMKDREPVVYGRELDSLRLATVEDIVRLKKAGMSDEVLQAIIAASRRDADVERDRALKQLQEMGVWVESPR